MRERKYTAGHRAVLLNKLVFIVCQTCPKGGEAAAGEALCTRFSVSRAGFTTCRSANIGLLRGAARLTSQVQQFAGGLDRDCSILLKRVQNLQATL